MTPACRVVLKEWARLLKYVQVLLELENMFSALLTYLSREEQSQFTVYSGRCSMSRTLFLKPVGSDGV